MGRKNVILQRSLKEKKSSISVDKITREIITKLLKQKQTANIRCITLGNRYVGIKLLLCMYVFFVCILCLMAYQPL